MQLTKRERVESRHIPAGYTEYRREDTSVVYASTDHLHAIAYTGTSRKPVWFYRFLNESSFQDRVNRFFESMKYNKDRVEQRRISRKEFTTQSKPGDIFVAAWGYDQTNIDFYQVLEVIGRQTLIVREIAAERTETLFMQGTCIPRPNVWASDSVPMIKRVQSLGPGREYITMNGYQTAFQWDGKPEHWSSYA